MDVGGICDMATFVEGLVSVALLRMLIRKAMASFNCFSSASASASASTGLVFVMCFSCSVHLL